MKVVSTFSPNSRQESKSVYFVKPRSIHASSLLGIFTKWETPLHWESLFFPLLQLADNPTPYHEHLVRTVANSTFMWCRDNEKNELPAGKIQMNAPSSWKMTLESRRKFWYRTCRLWHHENRNMADESKCGVDVVHVNFLCSHAIWDVVLGCNCYLLST